MRGNAACSRSAARSGDVICRASGDGLLFALSQTFAALADPTRRAILKRLGAYLKQLKQPTGVRHARRRKR